jgi:hypothetical protein
MVMGLNLAVRFLLELSALAALCYWGLTLGHDIPVKAHVHDMVMKMMLGVGIPLVAAILWGAFVTPRRRFDVPLPARLAVELIVFGAATAGLLATGHPVLGLALAVLAVLNRVLVQVWRQEAATRRAGTGGWKS